MLVICFQLNFFQKVTKNHRVMFLAVALEDVLLNRPDGLLSAALYFVCWATLRLTAFRFLVTLVLESFVLVSLVFGSFIARLSVAPGLLWPRLRRFAASSRFASADKASSSNLVYWRSSMFLDVLLVPLALVLTTKIPTVGGVLDFEVCLIKSWYNVTHASKSFQSVASDMIQVLTESNLSVFIPSRR